VLGVYGFLIRWGEIKLLFNLKALELLSNLGQRTAYPDNNASSRNHAKKARTGGCRSRPGTHSAL
jgi:hypothetical protein